MECGGNLHPRRLNAKGQVDGGAGNAAGSGTVTLLRGDNRDSRGAFINSFVRFGFAPRPSQRQSRQHISRTIVSSGGLW